MGDVADSRTRVMLRSNHVPQMMNKVEAVLARASRSPSGVGGVHYISADEGDIDLAVLRHLANIQTEFASGSARPVVGGGVRFAKRAVRRLLRWYVKPMMEQQTRFNHAALDLVERLRVQTERLTAEVDALRVPRGPGPDTGGSLPPET
jgi:hypothetical protein